MWRAAALSLLPLGCVVLYLRDPADGGIYPPCPFRTITGYDCPGCGTGRALHQLTHGRIGEAFSLNLLAMLALPVLGYLVVSTALFVVRGRGLRHVELPLWAPWALMVVVVGFAVVRNLPFEAVSWMASYR